MKGFTAIVSNETPSIFPALPFSTSVMLAIYLSWINSFYLDENLKGKFQGSMIWTDVVWENHPP